MYNQNDKLYKVSVSTGKMMEWSGWTEGEVVWCQYGQVGGKLQTQSYAAESKNIGRSNETTSEQQAAIELQAMYQFQIDSKHYRLTQEDALSLSTENREPRKVTNYKDRADKMSDILYSTVKKNGSRGCVLDGQLYSKIGRPEYINVGHLRAVTEELGDLATFDAEIFGEGLSLQRIRSAWLKPYKTDKELIKVAKDRAKKVGDTVNIRTAAKAVEYLGYNPNEDAYRLKFYVFDIPDTTGKTYLQRVEAMKALEAMVTERKLNVYFEFLYPVKTESKEERLLLRNKVVADGDEGLVHYEGDGVYEFGKRSTNTAKDKPRYDSEALVISVTKDKNGEGLLHCRACDTLDNVAFKCKMKVERRDGKRYERDYTTMLDLVGKWITFSYEELSETGTPTKPVGEEERLCDDEGNPLE